MLSKIFMQVRTYCSHRPQKYIQNAFGKHLLFTNTWTSGVLMVVGDVIEQEIEFQKKVLSKRYDLQRIGRMFFTGLLFGPLHHYFYVWLNNYIPQRTFKAVCQKVVLDQIIMSPLCIAVLFYSMGLLERKQLHTITFEMKEKFIPIYVVDWCTWPPTQFINFYYLPVKYQVLYINGVTMLYNVYLSYMKHKEMS